jgi:hypothetical protein
MPHHEHEVEVFDARTGAHLGAAFVAGRASAEQIAEVHQARAARRQLQADLRAAGKDRRIRYAAATVPAPPQPVTAVTAAQAAAEFAAAGDTLRAQSRPGLIPPGPPAPGWVLPRALAQPLAGPGADVPAPAAPGRCPAAPPSPAIWPGACWALALLTEAFRGGPAAAAGGPLGQYRGARYRPRTCWPSPRPRR